MMAIDSFPPIVRSKSNIDTSILRSKFGHAILKGGSFYTKVLNKTLHQLNQDVKSEIRIINYQMRILMEKNQKNMKRSEKLISAHNLPPIKGGNSKNLEKCKGVPDISVTGQSITGSNSKDDSLVRNDKNTEDNKIETKVHGKGTKGTHLKARQDSQLIRRTFCSPVPSKREDEEKYIEDEIKSLDLKSSSAFPHITVEQCEELFPPLKKEPANLPEYALSESQSRTGSTNSLGVPSPLIKRSTTDGKVVNIVIPTGSLGDSNFSRSEGSIPEALKDRKGKNDPRFRNLEAVLKPATSPRAQRRSPSNDLQKTKEDARRVVSRSVSPKPRFSNIRTNTTKYQYFDGPSTP